eukprot:scaffold97677_cov29-Tisochrysis_lutea.AAC.1
MPRSVSALSDASISSSARCSEADFASKVLARCEAAKRSSAPSSCSSSEAWVESSLICSSCASSTPCDSCAYARTSACAASTERASSSMGEEGAAVVVSA